MAEHFFARQLGEYMRDKLKAELETELSLKTIQYGDLDPFPVRPEQISTIVPGIWIEPRNIDSDFATINERYHHYYSFRVVYVGYLAEGITQEHARRVIERVGDVIIEDIRLSGSPTPSGTLSFGSPAKGQMVWSIVRGIQYRPPEDNFLITVNANLFAAALTWDTRVLMFK